MKDTVYTVSNEAINTSNHIFADLNACNELADSLWTEIKNYEGLDKYQTDVIAKQKLQEQNLQDQLKIKDDIIGMVDKQNRKRDRKIKFQKIVIYVLGAFGIAELGYIGLQSLNPG